MSDFKLVNGAKVIRKEKDIVLADWNGELVTWKVDSKGNAVWGHYFQGDLLAAVEDFNKRIGQ